MKTSMGFGLFILISLCHGTLRGQEVVEIDQERATGVAKRLSAEAAKFEKPQVKIKGDAEQAFGLRHERDGILVVPHAGLSEETIGQAAEAETGAALALLFMSERFVPIIEGNKVDESKLRIVTFTDEQGNERTVKSFLLSARRVAQDDWRLYVYGVEKKPLLEAKFSANGTGETKPVLLKVEGASGSEGTLNVIVFGRYGAGFKVRYDGN